MEETESSDLSTSSSYSSYTETLDGYFSADDKTISYTTSEDDEMEREGRVSVSFMRCRNWRCINSSSKLSNYIKYCGLCGSETVEIIKTFIYQDLVTMNEEEGLFYCENEHLDKDPRTKYLFGGM